MNASLRDPASEQLAWQLVTWGHESAQASLDSDQCDVVDDSANLEHALASTDPVELAHQLYVAVLGRPPEPGSMAADGLANGLSPITLAQSLLDSHEAEALPKAHRERIADDLTTRRFREVWGLPLSGSLGPCIADPNLPLILASYRVGLGRPPLATELSEGRRLLSGGLGRERWLNVIWREPGTKTRIFGEARRDLRGVLALIRRPHRFSVFRSHVLSAESALSGMIMAIHLATFQPAPQPIAETIAERELQQWPVLARINEVSAGIRRLVGDQGW